MASGRNQISERPAEAARGARGPATARLQAAAWPGYCPSLSPAMRRLPILAWLMFAGGCYTQASNHAVPATFVVNPEGGIVQRHVGLLRPDVTEHEIRSLAHLDTPAEIEFVPDTGQVLIANAAYATEIPGVDLTSVTTKQKETILKRLNTEKCTCGCDRTLAGCRIEDPACQTSLPAAKKVAAEVIGGK